MIALTTKENSSGTNSMEPVLTAPSKSPKPANAWYVVLVKVQTSSLGF